jgi:hypothetical protein
VKASDHVFDPAQINGLQKADSRIGRLPHALHALYSGTNPAKVPGFSFLADQEFALHNVNRQPRKLPGHDAQSDRLPGMNGRTCLPQNHYWLPWIKQRSRF